MEYQVTCPRCRANIGIMSVQVGLPMRCPYCHGQFSVSDPTERDPSVPLGRIFSFRCSQCNSPLEAYTGLIGRQVQCPTCAVQFEVPPPDGRIKRAGGTELQTEYAQPVHAYAAAGDNAPKIVRLLDGRQAIRCPRCKAVNSVDANSCRTCAAPFTLEGAAESASAGRISGLGIASLVLGIIGLLTFFVFIPSVLAVVFGALGLREKKPGEASSWRLAIAGLILGVLGLLAGLGNFFF
ncbi:MAG: DUF4190 domain-containing protein [Planctomycetes bacterium]|nr:DUF4190 domain-containing protein [Planctomycetota bacterium]